MFELLLGVLIVALILVILRRRRVSEECDERVQYFSKTYDMPMVDVMSEGKTADGGNVPSMHDRINEPRAPPSQNGSDNQSKARWAVDESQTRVDDTTRSCNSLNELQTRPTGYEGVKNSSGSNLAHWVANM